MYTVGEEIVVRITAVKNFGVFFKANNEYIGLVHISEISDKFIKEVHDFFKVNDRIKVKILSIDEVEKKISASYKAIDNKCINRFLKIGSTELLSKTEKEVLSKHKEIQNDKIL